MAEFTCIYCDRNKDDSERSLEHIWPEGLGGQWSPDFFKTRDVCGRCNNLCGQFVDGEFQRSFFVTAEESQSALAFVDIDQPSVLPLIYMGVTHYPPSPTDVCEIWIGPRGESIFFLHTVDREDFASYAGGDPIKRSRADPGRVYLSFSKANLFWMRTVLLSVRSTFKKAAIRLLTITDIPDVLSFISAETAQSTSDRTYIEPLWKQRERHVRQTVSLDHGIRFQCKLALGFGHTLFGEPFHATEYAGHLRSALWEKDPQKRSLIPIQGTSLLADARHADEKLLAFRGAYTFVFKRQGDFAILMIYTPSGRSMRTVFLKPATNVFSQMFRDNGEGFAVVLTPGLQKHFGPYPFADYALHMNAGPKLVALSELEAQRKTIDQVEKTAGKWDLPLKRG